jgi:hypothetical protein
LFNAPLLFAAPLLFDAPLFILSKRKCMGGTEI